MSTKVLYRVECKRAEYTDAYGNKWNCGAAVYPDPRADDLFDVFEDDGAGNGNHLMKISSGLSSAKAYADVYCALLDLGMDRQGATHAALVGTAMYNAGLESAALTCEAMVVGGRAWTEEQEIAANALFAAAKEIRALKSDESASDGILRYSEGVAE